MNDDQLAKIRKMHKRAVAHLDDINVPIPPSWSAIGLLLAEVDRLRALELERGENLTRLQALGQEWGKEPCPVCGSGDWSCGH